MPAPSKVTIDDIVFAARRILEVRGLAGLTMHTVATEVGVRAPSLYKHVQDRDDLLARVRLETLTELAQVLDEIETPDAAARITAIAHAARQFGHRWPHGKALAFDPDTARLENRPLQRAVAPLLSACEQLVGTEEALAAARTLTAWMHGFTEMERAGAFELGGDVDAAYDFGIETIVAALSGRTSRGAADASGDGDLG